MLANFDVNIPYGVGSDITPPEADTRYARRMLTVFRHDMNLPHDIVLEIRAGRQRPRAG